MMAGIYGYIMLLWSWGSTAKAEAMKRQVVGLHKLLAISSSGSDEDVSAEVPLLLLPDLTRIARVRGAASIAPEHLACNCNILPPCGFFQQTCADTIVKYLSMSLAVDYAFSDGIIRTWLRLQQPAGSKSTSRLQNKGLPQTNVVGSRGVGNIATT